MALYPAGPVKCIHYRLPFVSIRLACVAGVRRAGRERGKTSQAREAWEDRTREDVAPFPRPATQASIRPYEVFDLLCWPLNWPLT